MSAASLHKTSDPRSMNKPSACRGDDGMFIWEEIAVDEDTFDMMVSIQHHWWGKVYEHQGRFKAT